MLSLTQTSTKWRWNTAATQVSMLVATYFYYACILSCCRIFENVRSTTPVFWCCCCLLENDSSRDELLGWKLVLVATIVVDDDDADAAFFTSSAASLASFLATNPSTTVNGKVVVPPWSIVIFLNALPDPSKCTLQANSKDAQFVLCSCKNSTNRSYKKSFSLRKVKSNVFFVLLILLPLILQEIGWSIANNSVLWETTCQKKSTIGRPLF